MKRGLLTLCAVASVVLVAACGGGNDKAAQPPSATLATTPTTARTTTTLSVEAQVEAAYLKSWDVYSHAVRTFDTSEIETAYTGRARELVSGEVARLKAANTPIVVDVDHDVSVDIGDDGETALVVDHYVNRNYRIDGRTNQPIDKVNDPGTFVERYVLTKAGESWVVSAIERLQG